MFPINAAAGPRPPLSFGLLCELYPILPSAGNISNSQ
jgi:hypothetical protein